ncbi:MAG: hypothetical protein MJ197_01815 [Bacteroidales bacterium]|nr:hypothetical protein [Bacteroidales bacterium]
MKHYLFILFVFVSFCGFAQGPVVFRQEFQNDNQEYINCIPFEQTGFLLQSFKKEKQTVKKHDVFTFTLFDTACKQKSEIDAAIPARKSAYTRFANKENIYWLSYQTSGTYTVTIVSKNLQIRTLSGRLPKGTAVQNIRAIGNYVYILGHTKDLPVLLIQNIETKECSFGKIIPLSKRNFSISSFEINEESGELYVFTKDVMRNDKLVKLHIYKDGQKTNEIMIRSPQTDKYIVSAAASRLQDGSLMISGTYGNALKSNDISVGIFLMKKANDGSTVFTKFINYLEINNFTSYLSTKKQERIEKRQERLAEANKELEMNYLMTPHKILEKDGEFILVAESFYPTYRQECDYFPTGMGAPVMHCYPVFDGFQYTHFFILSFNEQGEILWSNASPLQIEEKPYSVIHYLSVNNKPTGIQTMYSSWDKIYVQEFSSNGSTSNKEIDIINEDEKLLFSATKNVHWYNNAFLSYGNQRIKNKDEHSKRQIFFMQKIVVDE